MWSTAGKQSTMLLGKGMVRRCFSTELNSDQIALRELAARFAKAELRHMAEYCEKENHPVKEEWRKSFAAKVSFSSFFPLSFLFPFFPSCFPFSFFPFSFFPLFLSLILDFASWQGFLGINLPTKYGGLGLGNLDAIVVLEEL